MVEVSKESFFFSAYASWDLLYEWITEGEQSSISLSSIIKTGMIASSIPHPWLILQ